MVTIRITSPLHDFTDAVIASRPDDGERVRVYLAVDDLLDERSAMARATCQIDPDSGRTTLLVDALSIEPIEDVDPWMPSDTNTVLRAHGRLDLYRVDDIDINIGAP